MYILFLLLNGLKGSRRPSKALKGPRRLSKAHEASQRLYDPLEGSLRTPQSLIRLLFDKKIGYFGDYAWVR